MDIERDIPEGFIRVGTGGGCHAWQFEQSGFYVWITDNSGATVPCVSDKYVIIGFNLEDEKMKFEEGHPPILESLFELCEDYVFDVNGDYFSYTADIEKHSLTKICRIVMSISNDTIISKVVVGQNNRRE